MLFSEFLEASVPFDKADQIVKNLGTKYQPGSFGIEIEFHSDPETKFDDAAAVQAFEDNNNIPTDPVEWEKEHPKPVKPPKQNYVYNKTDPFANYSKIGFDSIQTDFPDEYTQAINVLFKDENKFSMMTLTKVIPIKYVYDYLKYLYSGNVPKRNFNLNLYIDHIYDFMNSEDNFDSWESSMKSLINRLNSTEIQNDIKKKRIDIWSKHRELTPDQMDLIDKILDISYKTLKKFTDYHRAMANEISEPVFNKEMKQKYRIDISDWKNKVEDWEEKKEEIEYEWKNFDYDEEFSKWLDKYQDNFIVSGDIKDEIKEVRDWFHSIGETTAKNKSKINTEAWNIFEDESGVIEIASPILQKNDFPLLKKVLDYLKGKRFSTDTGCHVHIGMPPLTDAFDLLSMIYLVDEKTILNLAQRSDDSIIHYADKKSKFFLNFYDQAEENKIYTSEEMLNFIRINFDKYFGVNVLSYFRYGTVEFRYLSSQVVNSDQIFKLIEYFMLLPNVAKSRNQFRFSLKNLGNIVFTRRMGGKIQVDLSNRNPKQEQMPVSQIRSKQQDVDLKTKLLQKYPNFTKK